MAFVLFAVGIFVGILLCLAFQKLFFSKKTSHEKSGAVAGTTARLSCNDDETTKRNVIERLKEQCCVRVRPSSLDGVGVFALADIPAGTNPFYGPPPCEDIVQLHMADMDGLSEDMRTMLLDYHLPIDHYIPVAKNGMPMGIQHFMNHSDKDFNIRLVESSKKACTKWLQPCTTREVKKGEELLVNLLPFFPPKQLCSELQRKFLARIGH